jgi:trehalose-phosphatase
VREFDQPHAVARVVAAAPRPLLVALDVDGVLAPLVDHADDATLHPDVPSLLDRLAAVTPVAIVSGRALDDLERRFGFPPTVDVYGSHGMEYRGEQPPELDVVERERLRRLTALAEEAAARAGHGACVERKPASVVLHVHQASDHSGDKAHAWLRRTAETIEGAKIKDGRSVLELLTRATSKATALAEARRRSAARSVLFVGDDVTDEEALRTLSPGDIGGRVGPGETAAAYRLADPPAVTELLRGIADGVPPAEHR